MLKQQTMKQEVRDIILAGLLDDWCNGSYDEDTKRSAEDLCSRLMIRLEPLISSPAQLPRYFVSQYTDGPATRWNVIDRQTQEWVRRFPTETEAQAYANKLNA